MVETTALKSLWDCSWGQEPALVLAGVLAETTEEQFPLCKYT